MGGCHDSWSDLGYHPLANLFPLANDDELKVLAEDIKTKGLQQPITVYQGLILDGRNRHRAYKAVAKEPPIVELPSDADPVAFVVSANLLRRHLNETQRGIVAAKLANMRRGGKGANPSKDGIRIAQEDAAKLLNVSSKTVERAAKLVKANIPDLVAAAEQGKVKVSTANKYAKMNDNEKQNLLAANEGDIVKAVQSLKNTGGGGGGSNTSNDYDAVEKTLP
jgi:ParB-like chromosome segregation protein Spo0J